MSAPTKDRKFYLRAPDLEFRQGGPIKIGNVITDMTLPQDPITLFDPMPNIISGSGYSRGNIESEHYTSANASLSMKLYHVFGGQAEAKANTRLKTTYAFDEISALYLEQNPTVAAVKQFREKDDEFKDALRNGPVYIVTGLKIAKGLRYSNQLTSERKAELGGGGRITHDAAVKSKVDGQRRETSTDTWTVLGDTILAYRLHIVKRVGWMWQREKTMTVKTHDPGDAGLMNKEEKTDGFDVETDEVSSNDVEGFTAEQEYDGVHYLDFEDGEEDWSLAVLDE